MKKFLLISLCILIFPNAGISQGLDCTNLSREVSQFAQNNDISLEEQKRLFDKLLLCNEYGSKNSTYNLGLAYKYGIGTEQDFLKAIEWFRASHKQGDDY